MLGQHQQVHTGWLDTGNGTATVRYAPHTRFAYRLPPSRLLYRLVVGFSTLRGTATARRLTG